MLHFIPSHTISWHKKSPPLNLAGVKN